MFDSVEDSHVHDGHRGRMRAKLLSHGQKIFDTYELLEMLLYHVVPYKDTNPIAKRLLSAFGDLDGVLSAEPKAFSQVSGVGNVTAEFISKVGRISSFLGAEISSRDEVDFSDYVSVGEFLVNYLSKNSAPCVVAMFFDNNMRLLGVEKLFDLDFESAGVKYGRFLDLAIRKRASVVISAHSHPHGPFYPSRGDVASNEGVSEALGKAGILHAEHYIVSGEHYAGISSLKNFARKFSQFPAIDGFINSKAAAISNSADAAHIMRAALQPKDNEQNVPSEAEKFFVDLFSHTSKNSVELIERISSKYRTVEGAMTASVSELVGMENENFACFVKLLAYVSSRRVSDKFLREKKRPSQADISSYLKALYLGQSVETAYLLCFDDSGLFLGGAIISEGTVNSTEILPRRALEEAIERSATRVILAHNHPFGNTEASADDVKLTSVMNEVFCACGIKLDGHYIVAGQSCGIISIKNGDDF